jgi:hypothetical protein
MTLKELKEKPRHAGLFFFYHQAWPPGVTAMPIIDVDSLGGLPEGSLLTLTNQELAQRLMTAAGEQMALSEPLAALIAEAATRLIETGE